VNKDTSFEIQAKKRISNAVY